MQHGEAFCSGLHMPLSYVLKGNTQHACERQAAQHSAGLCAGGKLAGPEWVLCHGALHRRCVQATAAPLISLLLCGQNPLVWSCLRKCPGCVEVLRGALHCSSRCLVVQALFGVLSLSWAAKVGFAIMLLLLYVCIRLLQVL